MRFVRLLSLLLALPILQLFIVTEAVAQAEMPDDFGLVFQGVGSNHVLNTFEGTYTYDADSSQITVPLELTEKQLKRIFDKLLAIDFFDFPTELQQVSRQGKLYLTDQSTAVYLLVRVSGQSKEVECPSLYATYDHKRELIQLVDLIQETLESHKAYRRAKAGKGSS